MNLSLSIWDIKTIKKSEEITTSFDLALEEKNFDNFKPPTLKSTKMIFGNWTTESAYNHVESQNFQVH